MISSRPCHQILKRSLSTTSIRKPPTLLTLADLSPSQIHSILSSASNLKKSVKASSLSLPKHQRIVPKHNSNRSALEQTLLNQTIAILFSKRSTRTRVASESSIAALGGNALFLSPSDIQLGVNESLYDTARVVSSMVDGIMARVGGHDEIQTLAENSTVPVINALSSRYHPTQILADLLTLQETYPSRPLSSLKIAWVGDSNNILNDMLVSFPRLGIDLSVATPRGSSYERDDLVWGTMEDGLRELGNQGEGTRKGNVSWSNDPKEAVKDADIIVTDTWISMGEESTKEQRLRDFKGFQVTEELAKLGGAKPDWKFMHCLPRKSDEVDDEVFYGPRSIVFPEAENRKWTIMALFDRMFGRWEL